jgi:hypothetical protein
MSFNVSGASTPDYPHIVGGQYKLNAQVNPAGTPISGSLDITGTIPGLATSGTLLTGTLSQFGFMDSGGEIFEFTYNVTGGDLAHFYSGQTGIILNSVNSGFSGGFANSFSSPSPPSPALGFSDNGGMVPEPATIVTFLGAVAFGLPVIAFRRLRQMRNR